MNSIQKLISKVRKERKDYEERVLASNRLAIERTSKNVREILKQYGIADAVVFDHSRPDIDIAIRPLSSISYDAHLAHWDEFAHGAINIVAKQDGTVIIFSSKFADRTMNNLHLYLDESQRSHSDKLQEIGRYFERIESKYEDALKVAQRGGKEFDNWI